jgi:hypothetical protein
LYTHTPVGFTLLKFSKPEPMNTWSTKSRKSALFCIPGTIFEADQWSGSKDNKFTYASSVTASHTRRCPRLRTGPAVSLLATSQAISSSISSQNPWSSRSCRVRQWWTRLESMTWQTMYRAPVRLRSLTLWLQGDPLLE